MQEVLRAWARIADRHLLHIFLLKLLLGSLLFVGLLWVIGDFGGDCRKLEEVEYLLEECSSRRIQLEEKAESGGGVVEQLKQCERRLERQTVKLEEAEVKMEDTRRAFGARVGQQVAREAQVRHSIDQIIGPFFTTGVFSPRFEADISKGNSHIKQLNVQVKNTGDEEELWAAIRSKRANQNLVLKGD